MTQSVTLGSVKRSRRPRSNVCLLRNGIREPGPSAMLHATPCGRWTRIRLGLANLSRGTFSPFSSSGRTGNRHFMRKTLISTLRG